METAKFYLRKKDSNGFSTIFLYVSANGQRVYYSTGIKVKEKDWSKQTMCCINDVETNNQLKKYDSLAGDYVAWLGTDTPTNENLKNFINNTLKVTITTKGLKPKTEPKTFFSIIDKFIADAPNRLNSNGEKICSRRVQMYVYEKQALKAFEKKIGCKLTFEDFDKQMITDFQTFITNKGLANNTVVRYIRFLFVFFRYAEDTHGIKVNQAFRKYKTHTNRKDSVVLNEREINQIWDYVPTTQCEANVRKLFLIGLHTGLRFSDYNTLKDANIDIDNQIITTIQNKTGQRVVLPLHPKLGEMLQNEELPRPISNEKFNVYVKKMMQKIGFNKLCEIKKIIGGKRVIEYKEKWELISSHTARRSFATNLYKAGINPKLIMMCTGHKDLDTFMHYIILDDEDKLNAVRNIWNATA